jgi:hypothetical protein
MNTIANKLLRQANEILSNIAKTNIEVFFSGNDTLFTYDGQNASAEAALRSALQGKLISIEYDAYLDITMGMINL